MIDRSDLETLDSAQVHERAIGAAKANKDLDWLWSLLGSVPAAEGQVGELEDSGMDIASTVSALNGYVRSDPSTADTLRPRYIDYLLEQQ